MNKTWNRFKIAQSYFSRSTTVKGNPIEVAIELTSRCNLKCVMCARDDHSKRGLGNMSRETFLKIIDNVAQSADFAWLQLAGEPLLHPQFAEFIDLAAEKGLEVGISTNGTLLDEKKALQLLNSKLSLIIFSLDAVERETYEKIRGADALHKLEENTKRFLTLKGKKAKPYTIVQMIQMEENSSQWPQFKRKWKKLGADAVYLKRFNNFGGAVEDLTEKASRPTHNSLKTNRPPCFLLWRQLAYYYDGTVVSCCQDFLHQSTLGNINDTSFQNIWNGPTMKEMRRKHLQGRQDCLSLCAKCIQPKLSPLMIMGSTLIPSSRARKLMMPVMMAFDRFQNLRLAIQDLIKKTNKIKLMDTAPLRWCLNQAVTNLWRSNRLRKLTFKKYPHHSLIHFENKIYSQNGEDGVIEEIFNRIGETNKTFIECGVNFGLSGLECNTRYLLEKKGWSGLWIDRDSSVTQVLAEKYNGKKISILNQFLNRDNFEHLLENSGIPHEVDLLSLDIDGNDYYLWENLHAFNPRVVIIEYNGFVAERSPWLQPYNPNYSWDYTTNYGANLPALIALGKVKGYRFVGAESMGTNAIFIRNDLFKVGLFESSPEMQFPAPLMKYLLGFSRWLPRAGRTV